MAEDEPGTIRIAVPAKGRERPVLEPDIACREGCGYLPFELGGHDGFPVPCPPSPSVRGSHVAVGSGAATRMVTISVR